MRGLLSFSHTRCITAPLLAALLLLGACDGFSRASKEPVDDPPPAPVGRDGGFFILSDGGAVDALGVCDTLADLRCEAYLGCGLLPEDEADAGTADCRPWMRSVECGALSWPARVNAGTLALNLPQAESCAQALMALSCATYAGVPDPCTRLLEPARALGASCYGGAFSECREGTCRGTGCPRSCRQVGAESEPCSNDSQCGAGLYCAVLGSNDVGACATWGERDAPCGGGYRCGTDLYCGARNTCESRLAEDSVCEGDQCRAGLACGPGGSCVARLAEGEACTGDAACLSGLFCDPFDQRCAQPSGLEEAAPCTLNQRCAGDLACVGASSTRRGACGRPGGEGAACLSSTDCAAHLGCRPGDEDRSICQRRQPDQSPCDDVRDCSLTSVCVEATCRAMGLPGDDCAEVPCLFGACERTEVGATCVGLAPPNAPCGRPEDCGSESCVEGRCLAVCAP